jgi:hypothetical protein
MVNLLHYLSLKRLNELPADVEAENVELGISWNDLAVDVDGDMADEDPQALDSDDEQPGENETLGIDVDETESKQVLDARSHIIRSILCRSSNAYCASVLPFAQ